VKVQALAVPLVNADSLTPRVDLAFRLAGKQVPRDHGYALFGAICRILGDLHGAPWLAVHPINGLPRPDGTLALDPRRGSLRLRVEPAEIPRVLPLAGKRLELDGHTALVGVSSVHALAPAPALVARMVTIKGFMEPEPFREAAARQLEALEVKARVEVGRRRVLRVNGDTVVGFGVTLHDLDEEGALAVQYAGLGGKQRMGCGVFVPLGRRR
jgi:CRISPR-associated protein Cas6